MTDAGDTYRPTSELGATDEPDCLSPQLTNARVLAVIVAYRSAGTIGSLITSLLNARGSGVALTAVVVDNAAEQATEDAVRDFPAVHYVQPRTNLGYGPAVNVAARRFGPFDALLALNADLEFTGGTLGSMLTTLRRPATGVVIPAIQTSTGARAFNMFREPTITRALGDALLGGRIAGRFAMLGEENRRPTDYKLGQACDWALGAVLLVSSACWHTIGGFNEGYFLYSEDADFCLRARDAGLRTRFDPRVVVKHIGGQLDVSPSLRSLYAVNRVHCYRQRHGPAATCAFLMCALAQELRRGHKHASRAAAISLLRCLPSVLRRQGRPPTAPAHDDATKRPSD